MKLVVRGSDQITYATISYGWKSSSFYRHQFGLDKNTTKQLTSGFLDPSDEQSKFAEVFLEPFSMMIKDPNFTNRINKRYTKFKEAISTNRPFLALPDTIVSLKP